MKALEKQTGLSFFEFIEILRNRTGMFVPAEDYSGVSSIVLGFDLASGDGVLEEFRQWLRVEHGIPSNLSWMSGVLHLAGIDARSAASLDHEEQRKAVTKMFELLSEYSEVWKESRHR